MAHFEPCNYEFIDLTDVEEPDKNLILTSLKSWDPNVILLPWKTHKVPCKTYCSPGSKEEQKPDSGECKYKLDTENVDLVETYKLENLTFNLENNVEEENSGKSMKSWASLFSNKSGMDSFNGGDKSGGGQNSLLLGGATNGSLEIKSYMTSSAKYDDPNYYRMGEFLAEYEIDNRITSLQPKGLINRSNYCYINSILQALLACPPMFNMLTGLGKNVVDKKRNTPFIDSMARFVAEFQALPPNQRMSRRPEKNQKKDQAVPVNCGTPFEPNWIYKVLSGIRSDTFVVEGLQEDAEEFLGCLLNGLNDEMVELIKLVKNSMASYSNLSDGLDANGADKEWQVMGPKNKGCVTRRAEISKTPISSIFGGHLRSRIHRTGDQSTDSIQPFFTLPLNIEKVSTVREALEALVLKNQLEGVTSSKTNEEVEAWQQVTIEELPIVLILHLKCFDYKSDGCTKILKGLEFPIDLKIDSKLLSSKTNYSVKEKQYKLFAVVYHDGKEASKGHYVTDVYHVGYASWLRYDDASVKTVQEEQVLNPSGTRVPYLLFYRRSDSVKLK